MSSVTISQTQSQTEREQVAPAREVLTLRLVPKRRQKKKAVRWAEDVVDNENLGKKSSKKCCIYHKQQQVGDWDMDEDSDCEDCGDCSMEGNAAES